VSCTFTNLAASSNETVEDFPQAVWHNGAAWTVTANTVAGSTTINAATGHFNAATDINHPISGGVAPFLTLKANTFIVAVNSPTQAVLSQAALLTKTGAVLTVDNGSIRTVADGATTSASTTVTSATANFQPGDAGRILSGTNIPNYDAIATVNSTTNVTLTTAATATGTAQTLTVGAGEFTSSTRQLSDAQISSGSTTLTSASANFQASDVQLPVTGCGIPAGDYVTAVTNPTTATLNAAATLTRPISVADGATTSGSAVVTSATAGFTTACDADKGISGTGIPAGAYIKTVTNASTVTISANATATGTSLALTETPGDTVVVGAPSATAPTNGDQVSNVQTTLTLSPALVKGADPCAAGHPSGETIDGGWYNPGSYQANTLALAPTNVPANSIAEIVYPTSVVSFDGYIVNVQAGTVGEQDAAAHTDIVLPFVPTSLALCSGLVTPPAAQGIGSIFNFEGSALSQQKVPTGVGRPSSADIRGVNGLGAGVPSVVGEAWLINGKGASPYHGNCTTNFPAAIGDKPCVS
jgi:hypothetical protein